MMTTENQNPTEKKYPTHTVYFLKNSDDQENADWIRTGAAWEHGDAEGLNISLRICGQPISLVIRKNKPKAE